MKLYVASSWRNIHQPSVVRALRDAGHEVYDFRNPKPGDHGFSWSEISSKWRNWSADEFRRALRTDIADRGFRNDYEGMLWADACVLLLPCGRSAHLEAGWFSGQGRPVFVLTQPGELHEPELMYLLCDTLCIGLDELLRELANTDRTLNPGT